ASSCKSSRELFLESEELMTAAILRHRVLPSQVKTERSQFARLAAAVNDAANLQEGAQGPAVEALQRALRGVGAFAGPVTGTFDAATKAAVEKLQSAKHLGADGVFDGAELSALRAQQMFVKSGFQTP